MNNLDKTRLEKAGLGKTGFVNTEEFYMERCNTTIGGIYIGQ